MPSTVDLAAVAREMKDAQDRGAQIAPFSSRIDGFDVPAAYAVADLIHRERVEDGATTVGRKIGFTNPGMWSIYGVGEPIWGYLYDSTVVHVSGGRATCSLDGFAEPKIEPEIVLHFHASPPPGGSAMEILATIDWIALGFEIVQSHFPGWKFRAADTVADWGLHARLLVGEPQRASRLGPDLTQSLERFSLSLFRDGKLCETGRGANVLGSPLLAIAHLGAILERQPEYRPLQSGDLVTTGTITTAHSVSAGERWRAEVQGIALSDLSVELLQ